MIDLHMHTKNSDGTDTILEILNKCNRKKLGVISITDHNTCESYLKLENENIKKIFDGKIIVGCEFTASYSNRLIEILGYGFDYHQIDKYLKNRYDPNLGKKNVQTLFNRLVKLLDKYNFKYDYSNLHYPEYDNDFFEVSFYKEIIQYSENLNKIDEDIFSSFSDFFRKGLTNHKSKLFINAVEFKPSAEEIIDVIHNAGGIAFLAHPYQYKFSDTEDFLEDIIKHTSLDGIECFYTTFTEEQSNYLVKFAHNNSLLISGGSDYHGANKQNHELGVGGGNLNIPIDIIEDWNIEYFY